MEYLIGYGSLIDPEERRKAGLSPEADTVRVRGFRRSWNVKASNKKTYLGVSASRSGLINAVLFPVNEGQLSQLDGREGAYDRSEVEAADVIAQMDPSARIWIYVTKPEWISEAADPGCAVKRGYVDTVIRGCLSYGDAFCAEFIATTDAWEQHWFDNRKAPPELRERIDAMVGRYYPASMRILTPLPSPMRAPGDVR